MVTRHKGHNAEDGTYTDADIHANNKDGAAGTPSMRTLGTGASQAAAGNHTHSDLVTGFGTSVADNIPVYKDTSGKIIYDSGFTTELLQDGDHGDVTVSGGGNTQSVTGAEGGFAYHGHISPAEITADTHDYLPDDFHESTVVHLTASSNWAITGFDAGINGEIKQICNDDTTEDLFLMVLNGGSVSDNQIDGPTDYIVIPHGGSAYIMYHAGSTNKWKPIGPTGRLVGPFAYVMPSTSTDGMLDTGWLGTGTADANTYLNGGKSWEPISSIEWTQHKVRTSDQGVTNSATLVDDNTLQWSVGAGECWYFELLLLYSANSTAADFKFDLAVSAGSMTGWHSFVGDSVAAADTINVSTGVRDSAVANWAAAVACGTDASDTPRTMMVTGMVRFTSAGTFKMRFAQNTATTSTTSKSRTGSILRGRKLV